MSELYWLETLGCPKNQVDSDKLAGMLESDGMTPASSVDQADLVVVNTCAFIEAAREESIETLLNLSSLRRPGARLVATGCLAERHGDDLALALPEVDLVAGFGIPVTLSQNVGVPITLGRGLRNVPTFDLLNLPRPPSTAPWAYVKVAEGCDRHCGFCAIPSFRGRQRSRTTEGIIGEIEALGEHLREVVLVAQDLASWALDRDDPSRISPPPGSPRPIVDLFKSVSALVDRVRLLYLYPSSLDDDLIDSIASSEVPYFDLSLQHVSRPLLGRMRRPGDGEKFLEKIAQIRSSAPNAALRSSFILGYPGETEEDHDLLLDFLEEAQLDWGGFFTFSEEVGTHALTLDGKVPPELATERLRECSEVQDQITARRRESLIGVELRVLVDQPGVGRSHIEAPEIDGIVTIPEDLAVGSLVDVIVTGAAGPDLEAVPTK